MNAPVRILPAIGTALRRPARGLGVWLAAWCALLLATGCAHRTAVRSGAERRPFDFARDTLAFTNETVWSYASEPATGRMAHVRRDPPPTYTLRCFVLARAAKEFRLHARFAPGSPRLAEPELAGRVREVIARGPRDRRPDSNPVEFPGFTGLRELSAAHAELLQAELGGAWRSYVQRGNWRMVFPFTRRGQAAEAERLAREIADGATPVVHLSRFPALTINHAVLLYGVDSIADGPVFRVYDPNDPGVPRELRFRRAAGRFEFPPTPYYPGGRVDVYEVYRNWRY